MVSRRRIATRWHEHDRNLFEAIKCEIEDGFSDLRLVVERGTVFVRGSFPIRYDAEELDRFRIEIEFPDDFPKSVPILREIGGRIPWHADRHVNHNGEACPIVPEEWLARPEHNSILYFLNGPVLNFFLGQVLFEQGQPWPFGERSHGKSGLLEAYGELLGTTDETVVRRYLDILSRETLKGHWECFCGSQKRLRNCHLDSIKIMREKISPEIAKQALKRLVF